MSEPSWHAAALHDLEHSGLSIAEIADKYQRSAQTVHKLHQRHGVTRKIKHVRRGPRREDQRLPISPQHQALGIRLNMTRGSLGTKAFAEKLGVSSDALSRMELGQYDFRLSQLLAIATLINQPLDSLVKSFESNLYSNGRPNARN